MKWSTERKIFFGLTLAFVVVLLVSYISFKNSRKYVSDSQTVVRSYEMLAELGTTLSLLEQAETSQRGYIITGDSSYLMPYNESLREVAGHMDRLTEMTVDNHLQQERVGRLEPLIAHRLEILEERIHIFEERGFEAARTEVRSAGGKAVMDSIRAEIDNMGAFEQQLLGKRLDAQQQSLRETIMTFSLLVLAIFGVFLLVYLFIERDLSGRKHAEREIQRTRDLLDSVVENIPAMVFLKDAKDLRFVRFNKAGEELLGHRSEELVGKNDYAFFPKEEADFFTAKDREVLASHGVIDIPEEPVQTRYKGLRLLHTKKIALCNPQGKPEYLLGISEDITEQIQAAEALRESEQKFSKVFHISPVGISITGVGDGRFVDVNDTYLEIFGYTRDEVIGRTTHEMHIFDDPLQREQIVQALQRDGFVHDLEVKVRRKSGEVREMLVSLELIEIGGEQCTLSLAYDITDRKRNEAEIRKLNRDLEIRATELEAVNKELEAFGYSVSHDLRAPLRSIDGFSQALLEDHGGSLNAQAKEYLQRVRKSSQRMAELIDDLLNLSRVTRGEMQRESVNLSESARTIAHGLQKMGPERKVEFQIAEEIHANGDPRLLHVVMENLLGNAWKYTSKHERARIEFGLMKNGQECVYFVRDDGAGFDMSYADKLFAAFQRLHGMKEFPGTGVGLATVQRIVHRHGGRIWAESKVEQGATFFFTLS